MALDKNIQDVLRLQDVQLANAMNTLRADPSKLNTFITDRKADLYNTVTKEHSDNFQKVYGDLTRASNTTKNILYYHVRNKDLDSLQNQVYQNTKGTADAATMNSQNAKRQVEMNEWSAENKRDTLFVLQLTFIVLTLTAPLLYVQRMGLLPSSVFYGIIGLLVLAVILTITVRAQYTEKTRDQRFWNRRQFAKMGGPPVTPTCEEQQGLYERGANALANVEDSMESNLNDVQSRLTNASNALFG
jgi:hypothetical protein